MKKTKEQDQIIAKIAGELPNFPTEIIEKWLLSFAEDYGWPPSEERLEKWSGILTLSINEWRGAEWTLETWDMRRFPLSFLGSESLTVMKRCYWNYEENYYTTLRTEGNGAYRHNRALRYLLKHGKFPLPIIAREDFAFAEFQEVVKFRLMDGNHRFLAWHTAKVLHQELIKAPNEMVQQLKDEMKIVDIVPLSSEQEVWIARFNK